jgi:3-hydroxyacyl-CoA dehydrogenase
MAVIAKHVRRAAVLGAGVMGAQIAAHLANAGVGVVLFELPAEGTDTRANARHAIERLPKTEPNPLAVANRARYIRPASYAEDLELLESCDLVVEAIAERFDLKADLYGRVAPHLAPQAVLATNTSGLGIAALARHLPPALRPRFCGVHFFNPPRYMQLVELVPGPNTDAEVLAHLERFLVSTLGKGVVRAKDTPNFIANRIGVFSMLATLHHAERYGVAPDVVDALTGPAIGRPKSATFRTADLVGLDTLTYVVGTMTEALPDDPWHAHFALPEWLAQLVADGALGRKSGRGVYRKTGDGIVVWDPGAQAYRPARGQLDPAVRKLLEERDPGARLAGLRATPHPQAQFLWSCLRDLFHYSAVHLRHIADSVRDVDLALRWGYGWRHGPFESWQLAGWPRVLDWLREDIESGGALANAALPGWVHQIGDQGPYGPEGAFAPDAGVYRPRSRLDVYRRQALPDPVLGEPEEIGENVFETAAVRLWHTGDGVAVLTFKSKMHTIGDAVLDGISEAVTAAEADFRALVLWHPQEPFSVGADLKALAPALEAGNLDGVRAAVEKFQHTSLGLRGAMVPVVAAVRGLALGGGCELLLHCDRVIAALESYIGLVEAGVGLLPAGGGCKELAIRAAHEARGDDPFPFVQRYFRTVAMAEVARSAEQARDYGYLRASDPIVLNPYEILHVAKREALALAEAPYRPPLPPRAVPVAGARGVATLQSMMVNMLEGGFISEHDFRVGSRIAQVLCGGDIPAGTPVEEDWLLALERAAFVELVQTAKTQERIAHTLKTGKPLRN